MLVVDDYHEAADTLAEVLALHGFRVRVAYSVGDALGAVAERTPCVVLIDPEMGGGAGWELVERLSSIPLPPKVVALTCDHRNARRCEEAGFAARLVKPYEADRLLALLGGPLPPKPAA